MRRLRFTSLICLIVASAVAWASDHEAGPKVTAEPAAHVADVFAWMAPDGRHVNLVMDVFPSATASARFSDKVQYVFHTRSRATFTSATSVEENVICTFDAAQKISCWGGDSFVTGDASNPHGLASADGELLVFAGLRDDPFFFNASGFQAMTQAIAQSKLTLTTDPAGCPTFDAATQAALLQQLQSDGSGGVATDALAGENVLALVVQVDKGLLTRGGSFVAVYGATHRQP